MFGTTVSALPATLGPRPGSGNWQLGTVVSQYLRVATVLFVKYPAKDATAVSQYLRVVTVLFVKYPAKGFTVVRQ